MEPIVATIVSEANEDDLFTVPDCDCTTFADGAEPEWYEDLKEAIGAWVRHAARGTPSWAVHFRRKHIIHVRNRYSISALGE